MTFLHLSVPDESWRESLADLPDVDLVVWDVDAATQPDHHLDLVLRPYTATAAGLEHLDGSRIGVVQAQSLGYDGVAERLPDGVLYCNAVGVHEESTAELALALALASARDLYRFAGQQASRTWEKTWGPSLIDQRVLLVGFGGIGQAIDRRLAGFGCEVTVSAHRRREVDGRVVHGSDELPGLLATSDVVFVAVPHDAGTDRLVDDAFLAALPDGALVVNVSRGKVADGGAIVRAGGRVRYASDVFDPEPLPADDPLWTAPGVVITPHVGGMSAAMRPRMEAVVRDQVARLARGEEPRDVVVGA